MNEENIKTWMFKAGIFALVTFGILMLSAVYYLFSERNRTDKKTFAVQGKGEVKVEANIAKISANFVSDAKDQETASKDLAAQIDKFRKTFKELSSMSIEEKSIKTENVSINPKYEYCYNFPQGSRPDWCIKNPSESKIVGYTASQMVTITIEKNADKLSVSEKASKVLGMLPALGARDVNGPNWEVDNKNAINEARKLAVEEARTKAQSIADSLGKDLGDVVYYNENNGTPGYPMMYARDSMKVMNMAAGAESAPAISVSAGEEKVSITVDITYELE